MAIDPQFLAMLQAGGLQQQGNFNPAMQAANMPMPNPNLGGGLGGFMTRAGTGLQNGLGRLSQGMFPMDPAATQGMDPSQISGMRSNAMMQMGLGMMAAGNRPGASVGSSLAAGYFGAQNNLHGAMQQGFENAKTNNAEKRAVNREDRQMERDNVLDARYGKQMDYQQEQDKIQLEQRRMEQDAAQKRFDASEKQQMEIAKMRVGGANGLGQPPSGYRWKIGANGEPEQEAIKGGPADPTNKTGNFQEAERTAAFLGTRLADAMKTLKAIPAGDQTPGVMETAAGAAGSEMGANLLRSDNRQRANAAQRDALDAALTLATGAAYTKEQIDAMRVSYFPQINDGAAAKADKAARFQMLLDAAKVKAGRAASQIDEVIGKRGRGATGTWDVQEVP